MPRPLYPPRGIFASTRLIFDHGIPASIKETALQLMALSWDSREHLTPPLTMTQLAELTGKPEGTLRAHLVELRAAAMVSNKQYLSHGVFRLTLAHWLFSMETMPAAPGAASPAQTPRQPTEQVVGEVAAPDAAAGPPARDAGKPPARPAPAAEAPARRVLSKKLQKELLERGVFPTLLPEIAASAYSEADLRALLAWCSADAPERPAGLFVGRLRAGAQAPKVYRGKPCHVCGRYGGHAPDCYRRFAQDIYLSP